MYQPFVCIAMMWFQVSFDKEFQPTMIMQWLPAARGLFQLEFLPPYGTTWWDMAPWPTHVAWWWWYTLYFEMILKSIGIPWGMITMTMMMMLGTSPNHFSILDTYGYIFKAQWHRFTHTCGCFYTFLCMTGPKISLLHTYRQVRLSLD